MASFRGGRGGSSATRPPRGIFSNGQWLCDCNPRLPTLHLSVKKEGPNKGRWFRTCQKDQNDKARCKFFLWDDDARPREARALANNSRTEPNPTNEATPRRKPPQRVHSPPPTQIVEAGPPGPNWKRSRIAMEEEDSFGLDEGDEAFNNELEDFATAIETPRKAAKTETYETPARRKLPWQKDVPANGLQTPQTGARSTDLFPTRFSTPGGSLLTPSRYGKEQQDEVRQSLTPASSPLDTPTPTRFKDAVGSYSREDLVQEVFDLLRSANVNLSNPVEQSLGSLLQKHSRQEEGIRQGREVLRKSIKAKDAEITMLTYRINTLEAQLEEQRALVKHLQWQVETGHHSDT